LLLDVNQILGCELAAEPLKVLLITDTHTIKGGAEKHFFTLKNALQKIPGVSVTSLMFGTDASTSPDTIIIKETSSKFMRQWWRMFLHPFKYKEIRREIQKIQPDIIHLHNVKKYTIALLKALRNYPVIQTVHDFSAICPTGWNLHEDREPCATGLTLRCWWRHKRGYNSAAYLSLLFSFYRMRKLLKKTVQKFIAPSPLLEHYLRINHFGATIYLPPFGDKLSLPSFSQIKPGHFLYVGQLEQQKGVDILVEEFALACQQNKNLILKLAGTGAEENTLREKVTAQGLEKNIIFLGWVKPGKYFDECMALIFSSVGLESFGMVITEAMAHGRAVIGTRRGPTTWLVDEGETGLLFDPLKKGDLAQKILLLADDVTLAQQYGKQGFEKLDVYLNDEHIVEKIMLLYEESR
jgi:glycosyltransferase involved in cell wall biosynthesis